MNHTKPSWLSLETLPMMLIIAGSLCGSGYLFYSMMCNHNQLVSKALGTAVTLDDIRAVSLFAQENLKGMYGVLAAAAPGIVAAISFMKDRLKHKETTQANALNASKVVYINEPVN